jgi:hypothetical protein
VNGEIAMATTNMLSLVQNDAGSDTTEAGLCTGDGLIKQNYGSLILLVFKFRMIDKVES